MRTRSIYAGLSLALALLVLVGSSSTSGAGVIPGNWHANFDSVVTFGDHIQGNVSGPLYGSFVIAIHAQPYNTSYPLFSQAITFAGNQTLINLSLPTLELSLGQYQINVTSGTGDTFYLQVIQILDTLNASAINNEIYDLQQQIASLQGEVQGLSGQVSRLIWNDSVLFWVFFALFVTLLLIDVVKRYLRGSRIRWRKTRESWRNFWFAPPIRTYSPDMDPIQVVSQRVNRERRFVSGYCEDCKSLRTEEEVVAHVMTHGRVEPKPGKDYWEQQDYDMEEEPDAKESRLKHPNFRIDGS